MIHDTAWLWSLLVVAACLSAMPVVAAPDDTDLVVENVEESMDVELEAADVEHWIFPAHGNVQAARSQVTGRTSLMLSELVHVGELTADQENKLRLAADIELRHIFDEVDRLREQFLATANNEDAQQVVWNEVAAFQRRVNRNLLGEGSFFAKTVQLTLDDRRRVKIEDARSERSAFQRQAAIEGALFSFEENVPLTSKQHDAIEAILTDALDKSPGEHDSVYVFYRVLNLPASQLKQVLDDRQWKLIDGLGETRTDYEQMLIAQGSLTRAEADAISLARGR